MACKLQHLFQIQVKIGNLLLKPLMPLFSLLTIFALTLFPSLIQASPNFKLEIVTEDFPPYNYEVDDKARGMSSEVVQAMLENADLDAKITFYPWARAYRIAQTTPNTLIYSIARIPERESLFEWIGVVGPYRTSFYKLRSNTDINVNSLEDARAHRVGVSQADVIETYLKNRKFERLEVASADHLAIRMLFYGRMDLLAFDEAALPLRVKEAGLDINQVERVFRIEDLSEHLYIAMHPESDPYLIQKLRESLEAIKVNGEYQAIHSRYFPDP